MNLSESSRIALEFEARAVREMFETGRYDPSEVSELVQTYWTNRGSQRDSEQLRSSIESCMPNFPRGWCDIASVVLMHRLGEGELLTGVYYKSPRVFDSHAVLSVGGAICDMTADQFGGPKLYVGEFVLPWTRTPYQWENGPLSDFEKWPEPIDLW